MKKFIIFLLTLISSTSFGQVWSYVDQNVYFCTSATNPAPRSGASLNEFLPSPDGRPSFALYLFVASQNPDPGFADVDLLLTTNGDFSSSSTLIRVPLRRSNVYSSAGVSVWPWPNTTSNGQTTGRILRLEGIWPEMLFSADLSAGTYQVIAVTAPSRRISNNVLTIQPPNIGNIAATSFIVSSHSPFTEFGTGVPIVVGNGSNPMLLVNTYSGVTPSTYFELQVSVTPNFEQGDFEVLATEYLDQTTVFPLTSAPQLRFNTYMTRSFVDRAIQFADANPNGHPVGKTNDIYFRVVSKKPNFVVTSTYSYGGVAYPFLGSISSSPNYYYGHYLTIHPSVPTRHNSGTINTFIAGYSYPEYHDNQDIIDLSSSTRPLGIYCMSNAAIPFIYVQAANSPVSEEIYIELSNSDGNFPINPVIVGRMERPKNNATPDGSNIWLNSNTSGVTWNSISNAYTTDFFESGPYRFIGVPNLSRSVWYHPLGSLTMPIGAYIKLDYSQFPEDVTSETGYRIRAVTAVSHLVSDETPVINSAGMRAASTSNGKKVGMVVYSNFKINPIAGVARTFELVDYSQKSNPDLKSSVIVFDMMGKQILSLEDVKISTPIRIPGDIKGKLLVRVTNETGSETHSIFVNQ